MTNTTQTYEGPLARTKDDKYVLRLYTAGVSQQSTRAVENLKAICDTYLSGRYELTVVDLYQQPDLAHSQQVFAAPTLVKSQPLPLTRLVGDLSDTREVLRALDLALAAEREFRRD